MSVKFDGAFPVGVSVGVVLLTGDRRQIVTQTFKTRSFATPYFKTRRVETLERQLVEFDQTSRPMHVDLAAADRDGTDHFWDYDPKRRTYVLAPSAAAWPRCTSTAELQNDYTHKDWLADRKAVQAGAVPGAAIYGTEYTSLDNPDWHYIEKSSLWLADGHLKITHFNLKRKILTIMVDPQAHAISSRKLRDWHANYNLPQAQPA